MKFSVKLLSAFISVAVLACLCLGTGISAFSASGDYDNRYSLTVGDNIVTNYIIDAAGYKSDGGTTLEYTYNNSQKEDVTTTTETVDLTAVNTATYSFSVPQAAAQISEPVTVTIKKSDGSVLDSFEGSAKEYCDLMINKTPAEISSFSKGKRLQKLCKSIIAYAYGAQQQFSEYMALDGTVPITHSYDAELDIPNANYTDTTGRANTKGARVSFKSISYFCTSSAKLRFYLNTANATAEELSLQPSASNLPDGVSIAKGYDNVKEAYYIDVTGLKPSMFDRVMTINYADASISMSVLHYAGMIISSTSSGISTATKYLAKTLVVYYDNTNSYFDDTVYVTYNGNSGTPSRTDDTVTAGSSVSLPSATLSQRNFDGWYTEATGGTRVGGSGDSYTVNDDVELYAHWSGYTVNYNANGGTVTPSSDTADMSTGQVTLPSASRSYHYFDGWYTEATGGTYVGNTGDAYTVTSDGVTLYAHWTAYTYTLNFSTTNCTITASTDGTTINDGGSVPYENVVKFTVAYGESDSRTFSLSGNVKYYTTYQNGTLSGETTSTEPGDYYFKMPSSDVTITGSSQSGGWCVTADTLITLADGTQKRIDALTESDELLVWNLETGSYDSAPSIFIDDVGPTQKYNVVYLYFSDGTTTKLIYEHGYFDLDKGKYVYITESNYREYIGDRFVKQADIDNNTWDTVTLVDSQIVNETARPYSTNTVNHLCFYVDGMLSMPGGITGLFNIFDVDTSTMTYDFDAMQRDIETYGLYTYDEFEDLISRDTFDAVNCAYLKIAVGKGLLTEEGIVRLAEMYAPFLD